MIDAFLAGDSPLLDVRSPGEYAKGHIPGALSFPLLSDDERAAVGTLYKVSGRDAAVLAGLDLVAKKLPDFARRAIHLAQSGGGGGSVRIYCFRGGMRSASMAWLLNLVGVPAKLLEGGYKAFRSWTLAQHSVERPLAVLGGLTGSGKTQMLQIMAQQGAKVIDLEALAQHRGSAFGGDTGRGQPSQEQFENDLAMALAPIPVDARLWIEDESRAIGTCQLPMPLYAAMNSAPLYFLDCPRQRRVERIVEGYSSKDPEELCAAVVRLERRLGGLRTKQVVAFIQQKNFAYATDLLLDYYDKAYERMLSQRLGAVRQFIEGENEKT